MKKRIVFISLAVVILCVIFAIGYALTGFYTPMNLESIGSTRNYHVIVTGRSDNLNFLTRVYRGAKKLENMYSAVVELYVPNSQAENVSLQSLLDYAGYVNADGIIAYIEQDVDSLKVPCRIDGDEIPLLTVGYYNQDIDQVSYIGNNYSEVGKRIAYETRLSMPFPGAQIYIISSDNMTNANYSTLMNSLLGYFKQNGIENFTVLDQSRSENEFMIEKIYAESLSKVDVFVCLTDDDTVLVSQFESRNLSFRESAARNTSIEKNIIIGFGENETTLMYMNKGVVSKLISVNSEKIGQAAIAELFEYRNKGHANSYISTEIKVRTPRR